MAPDAGRKKHRGLGGFLSSKPQPEPLVSNNQQPPPAAPKDTVSNENTQVTPIPNDGRIAEVDEQRNLAVNEQTGEVLDDDTGEVLTVTTTTTTVTKTETRRSRSPQPPTNGDAMMVEEQTSKQTTQQYLDPSSAQQAPNAGSLSQQSSNDDVSPQTYHSGMTNDSNFNRGSNQWPLQREENAPPRTAIENLKSAAAGLQDVRNSLRGTNVNDVRDSLRDSITSGNIPIPRRNPARSSRSQQQVPPVPTIKSPVPPSRSPAAGRPPVPPLPNKAQQPSQPPGQSQWQAPWPEPEEAIPNEGLRKRKSLSTMPATFSPESSGQQMGREKSPRLLKRSKNKKIAA